MVIRPEEAPDFEEIDAVVRAAFGKQQEVDFVHRIRASDTYVPELALVAVEDGAIVGHVMFSYATVGDRPVLQLAPLAVRPDRQKTGIGDALTRKGIELADARGDPLVLVLGIPEYYPRFGFESARALGIEPYIADLPDEVWMAKRLSAYDPSITGMAAFVPDA